MQKVRVVIFSVLVVVAMMSAATIAVFATNASSPTLKKFPPGTICGDVELGPWTTPQYIGVSNFQGYESTFVVNGMRLSGGQGGRISSVGGNLTVKDNGHVIFHAYYSNMKGHYSIQRIDGVWRMTMYDFTAATVHVTLNNIHLGQDKKVPVGSFKNVMIPEQILGCSVQDTFA